MKHYIQLLQAACTYTKHCLFTGRQVAAMEELKKDALSLGIAPTPGQPVAHTLPFLSSCIAAIGAAGVTFSQGDVSSVEDVER